MTDKSVKLLIVDDDEEDLYLINDALSEVAEARYEVVTASSALAAMAKLGMDSYDCIISDYRLAMSRASISSRTCVLLVSTRRSSCLRVLPAT